MKEAKKDSWEKLNQFSPSYAAMKLRDPSGKEELYFSVDQMLEYRRWFEGHYAERFRAVFDAIQAQKDAILPKGDARLAAEFGWDAAMVKLAEAMRQDFIQCYLSSTKWAPVSIPTPTAS